MSYIRKLSEPAEFALVLLGCSWFATASSIVSIASHSWTHASSVRMTNASVLVTIILELQALAVMYWIGRTRTWSFEAWGLKPSWRSTGAGVLLFLAAAVLGIGVAVVSSYISPGSVHRRTDPDLSLFALVLIVGINPIFEEALETAYFVQALQRHGVWVAVVASATFRAFLHAYQGVNAIVLIFPLGLIFGYTYWKWRRLWPLLLAHALLDIWALIPGVHAF